MILSITNPSDIIRHLTYYSPIILIVGVVSLSFIFQNFKGIFYLGVLLLLIVCREFIYIKMTKPSTPSVTGELIKDNEAEGEKLITNVNPSGGRRRQYTGKGMTGGAPDADCKTVEYSANFQSNGSYSAFIFAFTMMYIFLPMFINQNVNVWMLLGLVLYFVVDIIVKQRGGCVEPSNVFINVLAGFALSAILVSIMINSPGLSNLLFFNDYSSNKEICTMPKKQTFKCAVYKNGELIGSSTT
jgi:hypothetical protein